MRLTIKQWWQVRPSSHQGLSVRQDGVCYTEADARSSWSSPSSELLTTPLTELLRRHRQLACLWPMAITLRVAAICANPACGARGPDGRLDLPLGVHHSPSQHSSKGMRDERGLGLAQQIFAFSTKASCAAHCCGEYCAVQSTSPRAS